MKKLALTHNHIVDRETVIWSSYGKNYDEPVRYTAVKDLSDSHLVHIIGWIADSETYRPTGLQKLMADEAKYRAENHIFIEEYK